LQGTAGCQAQPLLDFLRETECERMYLVGDIVDLWESSSGRVYWPQVRFHRCLPLCRARAR
jgi:UDP-2,3-diacylglucosamine pyrophosphatase LpxH